MLLSQLVEGICDLSLTQDTTIREVTSDSRNVVNGSLFVAIKGQIGDGHHYIEQAIEQGAVCIVCDKAYKKDHSSVVLLHHADTREVLAKVAARFYPNQPEHVVAVTGTNGKTSVAHFCQQIWSFMGFKAASLGTMGLYTNGGKRDNGSLTTPDPVALHRRLDALASEGYQHLALEASSHGLDQKRMDGVRVSVAAFTNLSRDHLDYHHTLEGYFSAKSRLFTDVLSDDGVAVINMDDFHALQFKELCKRRGIRVIDVGKNAKEIRITSITSRKDGQTVRFSLQGADCEINLPLVGDFQAYNVLTALGMVIASGANAFKALEALSTLDAIAGRMQLVSLDYARAPFVYVDYAHTPDALEKALLQLASLKQEGALWVLFGCGGDRDKGKRADMGAIASRIADKVVVTDDNPRDEDAAQIRHMVLKGCSKNAVEKGNRKQAIEYAVQTMESGDILLIAGKGHENYQLIAGKKHDFDDVTTARNALKLKCYVA